MVKQIQTPIAVVGLSNIFPESRNPLEFWKNIVAGNDLISDVPEDHWLLEDYYSSDVTDANKVYASRGGFLPKIDFDPLEFGIPPNDLSVIDTVQLLSLVCAKNALADTASVKNKLVDRKNISVILGTFGFNELIVSMAGKIQHPHWRHVLKKYDIRDEVVEEICQEIADTYSEWREETTPGLLSNVISGRIANRLNLGGTNCIVDSACASSLTAMGMAIKELELGHSDLVLTGGADALNDIFFFMCFSRTPAFSKTNDCRPFSNSADGTMIGEGIGLFALRRLEDAERDGDQIYAVIKGYGASSDGNAKSIYAPSSEGQSLAIERALQNAGIKAADIELVEAHGTATSAGDLAEFQGLKKIFSRDTDRKQWCALGSIKSQVGHTKGAAGAAGAFKVIMALNNAILPPTIKIEKPNEKFDINNSPFYLNTFARPWIHGSESSRIAGVSSFGFGGTNAHMIFEEYLGDNKAKNQRIFSKELYLFSARSFEQLKATINESLNEETDLAINIRDLQENFDVHHKYRVAFIASNTDELRSLYESCVLKQHLDNKTYWHLPNKFYFCCNEATPEIAFIFSGQGSQYVNMGLDLANNFSVVREAWDQIANIELDDEIALQNVVYPIPAFTEQEQKEQLDMLTRTEWAQPAIGAVALSQLALLEKLGVSSDIAAGHSYGEIMALYAGGAFDSINDVLSISRKRGELMANASGEAGAMTAVNLGLPQVSAILEEHNIDISIANVNSKEQVVVSGLKEGIEKLEIILEKQKIRFKRLPVHTAFHSNLVSAAKTPILEYLEDMQINHIQGTVYSNQTAQPYSNKPEDIRTTLASQLAEPVYFYQQINKMYEAGTRIFLEIGPGSILTNLVKDSLDFDDFYAVSIDQKKVDGVTSLLNAIALLSVLGRDVNYSILWDEYKNISLDNKKLSKASVKINGANYGKPYQKQKKQKYLEAKKPVVSATVTSKTSNVGHFNMSNEWLETINTIQNNLAEAQKEYQKNITESHLTFLRTSEALLNKLSGESGQGISLPVLPVQESPVIDTTEVIPLNTETVEPVAIAVSHVDSDDVYKRDLFSIITEKTGYPDEMLELEMNVEADLGIDSLKRTQILTEFGKKYPVLNNLDASVFAPIKTLGDIIELLKKKDQPNIIQNEPHKVADNINRNEVHRFGIKLKTEPLEGFIIPSLLTDTVYIYPDNIGIAELIVEKFKKFNIRCQIVEELPSTARNVLVLCFLENHDDGSYLSQEAIALKAFKLAKTCAQAQLDNGGAFILVHDTGGDYSHSAANSIEVSTASLGALSKVIANEWQDTVSKSIDIARDNKTTDDIADLIIHEMVEGDDTVEVAYKNNERFIVAPTPISDTNKSVPIQDGDIFVVSGGGKGITATCITALAEKNKLKLAILGRSRLEVDERYSKCSSEQQIRNIVLEDAKQKREKLKPIELNNRVKRIKSSKELHSNLEKYKNLGCEVEYYALDIADAYQVQNAVDEAREKWGKIDGVIHGAGIVIDNNIVNQSIDDYVSVFFTKVKGFDNLQRATYADKLKYFCCFSSISSRIGNAGQVNYAMANELLNKMCQVEYNRRKRVCVVKSINWGPWNDGMVTEEIAKFYEQNNVPLLAKELGKEKFVEEIQSQDNNVEVVITNGGLNYWRIGVPRKSHEVLLNKEKDNYLLGHRINNTVVVPMVLVCQYIQYAAKDLFSDNSILSLVNINFYKGLQLPDFLNVEYKLFINTTEKEKNEYLVTVGIDNKSINYNATVVENYNLMERSKSVLDDIQSKWEMFGEDIYKGDLFHTHEFQVIQKLSVISESGCYAMIYKEQPHNTLDNNFYILDGGGQLAILWRRNHDGKYSLPTGIKELVIYEKLTVRNVYCFLKVMEINEAYTEFNIYFYDYETKDLLAEMLGLTMYVVDGKLLAGNIDE